jgi:hypothetical protein
MPTATATATTTTTTTIFDASKRRKLSTPGTTYALKVVVGVATNTPTQALQMNLTIPPTSPNKIVHHHHHSKYITSPSSTQPNNDNNGCNNNLCSPPPVTLIKKHSIPHLQVKQVNTAVTDLVISSVRPPPVVVRRGRGRPPKSAKETNYINPNTNDTNPTYFKDSLPPSDHVLCYHRHPDFSHSNTSSSLLSTDTETPLPPKKRPRQELIHGMKETAGVSDKIRTRGRRPGSLNKKTIEAQQAAAAEGITAHQPYQQQHNQQSANGSGTGRRKRKIGGGGNTDDEGESNNDPRRSKSGGDGPTPASEKKYICTVPNCGRAYKNLTGLINHGLKDHPSLAVTGAQQDTLPKPPSSQPQQLHVPQHQHHHQHAQLQNPQHNLLETLFNAAANPEAFNALNNPLTANLISSLPGSHHSHSHPTDPSHPQQTPAYPHPNHQQQQYQHHQQQNFHISTHPPTLPPPPSMAVPGAVNDVNALPLLGFSKPPPISITHNNGRSIHNTTSAATNNNNHNFTPSIPSKVTEPTVATAIASAAAMEVNTSNGLKPLITVSVGQKQAVVVMGDERPFHCTVPGCDKTYRNSNGLGEFTLWISVIFCSLCKTRRGFELTVFH